MNPVIEELTTLKAADVMTRRVVLLYSWQSMTKAAEALAKHEISGAPVIDSMGRCVGVLSAFDFIRRELWRAAHPDQHDAPGDQVGAWMSPRVKSVSPDTPLIEVAREMRLHHVHRLLVVDERNVPVGLISSLDLAKTLVRAVDASSPSGVPV
jgi:CBS domain-containing protein